MKTRHTFILLLALFAALSAMAQNSIGVASFQLIENDLTPILQGTEVLDQNGNTCALLKIQTSQTGFTFDVGVMGITKTEQHTGEIWVYVPFGVKHISIHHQHLGHLNDYYFPCSIEKGRTYRMELISGTVNPIVDEDLGGNYLVMNIEPENAQVYINDKPMLVENGEVSRLLPYGKYTYRVEAPSFMNEAGAFEIGKERVELNIRLVSAKATLTVNCPDTEADIYINDQKKARGNWTGQLVEGMYAIEARKPGHRNVKQVLNLAKQEQKTLTLNAPEPIYGKLNLDSSPSNCEVYLDGKQIGKSPNVFNNILIGSHTLELRKNGYDSQSKAVSIEEGKITDMEMTLQRSGSVAQQPEVRQPQQNETPAVQTDKKKTFIMAKTNYDFDAGGSFGVTAGRLNTFGPLKKMGWYATFLCGSNSNAGSIFDGTVGLVTHCKNTFYTYCGAGYGWREWGKRYNSYGYEYIKDGIQLELGIMFHFKHKFSFMAGGSLLIPIYLDEGLGYGVQFGLGYNF